MDIDIPHLLESNLKDLGLSTRRAMTRLMRMSKAINIDRLMRMSKAQHMGLSLPLDLAY
jgi:hypothetical protein